MELDEQAMLSAIAQLTPFSDFNQSPRNMYQCQVRTLYRIMLFDCFLCLDGQANYGNTSTFAALQNGPQAL